jgi:hypothetical protein
VLRSNEGVEKVFRDIAPVMCVLQDRDIESRKRKCCDGTLQGSR